MAIVKMKRVRLIALARDKTRLLTEITDAGCVQPEECSDRLSDPVWQAIVTKDAADDIELRDQRASVALALDSLDKFARQKTPLLSARPFISNSALFDDEFLSAQLETADKLGELARIINEMFTEESRLKNKYELLLPWKEIYVPLQTESTANCFFCFGVLPSNASLDELRSELARATDSELIISSSDAEQHYILLICHSDDLDAAMALLKPIGFTQQSFKDMHGTASENITSTLADIVECEKVRAQTVENVAAMSHTRDGLRRAYDMLTIKLDREHARANLLKTGQAFFMEGWVRESDSDNLARLFAKYDCAFELTDPDPSDDVPVELRNSKLVGTMNLVTEMYSLPKYNNIDPNPLIFPFFPIFFGIMYCDLAYGLIVFIFSAIVLRKVRPRGTVRQLFELGRVVGLVSAASGLLFGGFFGDAITVIAETFFGAAPGTVVMPALINPVKEPMLTLVAALIIGAIQLFTGMCIKIYLLCRDGKPLDALFDVGSWWVLFAGIGVWVTGGTFWITVAGALMLILTQGRHSPSIGGKFIGGLASLYNITNYFSDILSYARLMALMMASSVIASVVNQLGAGAGPVFFILVFVIGHFFNMAVNIIGTYVHGARLQYLEYFSKFYESGGRPFKPLRLEPKYFDIIRKDN